MRGDDKPKIFSIGLTRNFLRNYVVALLVFAAASQIPWYLWLNYKVAVKGTPLGTAYAAALFLFFFVFLFGLPMSTVTFAEESPRQLLTAEQTVLYVCLISFSLYVVTSAYPQLTISLAPITFSSLLASLCIRSCRKERAIARLTLAKTCADKLARGDANSVSEISRFCLDALQLYNHDLRDSSGFEVRDIGRFCKPILLNVVSGEEQKKADVPQQIQTIIDGVKATPDIFLRSMKTLAGESVRDASGLQGDIVSYRRGFRTFLIENSELIVGVIAILLAFVQLVLMLSRP
jgi:hypothetical protein